MNDLDREIIRMLLMRMANHCFNLCYEYEDRKDLKTAEYWQKLGMRLFDLAYTM
jgi:hypothetical protein